MLRDGSRPWTIDINSPGKKRRRVDVRGSRKEADKVASRIRLEGVEAVLGVQAQHPLTVAQLRNLQLERSKSKASIKADEQRWKALVEMLGEERTVDSLRPSHIVEVRSKLETIATRRGKPHEPATVNRYLALLRSAFNFAAQENPSLQNPVKRDLFLPEDNARSRTATKDEMRRLIEGSAKHPELQLAILIARCSTLREGTIVALEWTRLDLEARTAIVFKRKRTKLARESRPTPLVVPLSKRAVEALVAWRKQHSKTEHVFTLKAASISSAFRSLTKRLGIVDLRFHDLRHTATTELANEGRLDAHELQRTGDWSSAAMLARYRHPDMSRVLAALDTIDDE